MTEISIREKKTVIVMITIVAIIKVLIIILTLFLTLTSAPFDTSKVAISKCPPEAASCNGVFPSYGINGDSN